MNSNELRIGNWVYHANKKECYRISEGYDIDCGYNYEPIQLTEEILLKCGFEKSGKYTFICNNALMQLELHVVSNKLLHSILAIEVKYLHQLQNLYFALTNQELDIEL